MHCLRRHRRFEYLAVLCDQMITAGQLVLTSGRPSSKVDFGLSSFAEAAADTNRVKYKLAALSVVQFNPHTMQCAARRECFAPQFFKDGIRITDMQEYRAKATAIEQNASTNVKVLYAAAVGACRAGGPDGCALWVSTRLPSGKLEDSCNKTCGEHLSIIFSIELYEKLEEIN